MEGTSQTWIDHVILGVRDLEEASARMLDEMGLASVPGGRHLAWGTANRIVPLGQAYVELLAVADRDAAGRNDVGREVMARIERREGLVGWCLGTADVETEAARLGLAVAEGARELPTGETVRWRWAGFDRALAEPDLPFFITWQIPPGLHPGRMEAPHRTTPQRIAWVQVSGDEEGCRRGWEGPTFPCESSMARPPSCRWASRRSRERSFFGERAAGPRVSRRAGRPMGPRSAPPRPAALSLCG